MDRRAQRSVLVSLIVLGGAACGARVIPIEVYAEVTNQDVGAFASFLPGARLALLSGDAACGVLVGRTSAELGAGTKLLELREAFPGDAPAAVTVDETVAILVEQAGTDAAGAPASSAHALGLRVTKADGSSVWLRLPAGRALSCIRPWSAELAEAASWLGQELVFTPWRPECREIAMAGPTAQSIFADGAGAASFVPSGLRLSAGSVRELLGRQPGGAPWLASADESLAVRADIVRSCFAPRRAAAATPPQEIESVMRTGKGTCRALDAEAKSFECRAPVGVWAGDIHDRGIEVRSIQRNLGPVRLANGIPVTGPRFASTLIAVTTAAPRNGRLAKLYEGVRQVIDQEASRSIGDVAVVAGEVPGAHYNLRVSLSRLVLGAATQHYEPDSSEFVARQETVPNPAYAEAEQKVREAQGAVEEAQAAYDAALKEYEVSKAQCDAASDAVTAISDSWWAKGLAAVGNMACQVAASPSTDDLVKAQSALAQAKVALTSTPRTKQVPVLERWHYKKKVYRRQATAQLRLTVQRASQAPQVTNLPIGYTWEDYEVEADAEHNVQGHVHDPRPLSDGDALLPGLGQEVAATVQRALRRAIIDAALEEAGEAFARAGGTAAADPADGRLDAAAFMAARERLMSNVGRGRQELGKESVAIRMSGPRLEPDQCALLVALPEAGDGLVELTTSDRFWADERGAAPAYVELCPDLGKELPTEVRVRGTEPGGVRWGIYATKRHGAAAALR